MKCETIRDKILKKNYPYPNPANVRNFDLYLEL